MISFTCDRGGRIILIVHEKNMTVNITGSIFKILANQVFFPCHFFVKWNLRIGSVRPSIRPCSIPYQISETDGCFFYTWHHIKPICPLDACHFRILKDFKMHGQPMHIFVPKLDLFTQKSQVSLVGLPKSSEMLLWDNILLLTVSWVI